ncbi:MerR family transcriptional regulator [Motiliproteus sp. MSK22-1]|uniref:MerR family transcriptional regulator n=1 Tax=Motiliproteus sp. MSK22-1 TaxID=1897630 RepID=UPI000976B5CA|nr:MerR family transcriptional regulator [Motiliproteus sp. MSK22-1]OMH29078.1 MerR family transcriptional regulator [Motiliproteus sp. MSK22-1]
MNIKAFSKVTELSPYTIRYYEKAGLLRSIKRNSSGHRAFTESDVAWARFIKRLKETGMTIENIRKYAELREKGEHTSEQRMRMLEEHAITLKNKIALENNHLQKLEEKIDYYAGLIHTDLKA